MTIDCNAKQLRILIFEDLPVIKYACAMFITNTHLFNTLELERVSRVSMRVSLLSSTLECPLVLGLAFWGSPESLLVELDGADRVWSSDME